MLSDGVTAVDDIGGMLYEHALEELFDELGFAADNLDIVVDKIETSFGPVFVFRDRRRVTLKKRARMLVAKQRTLDPEYVVLSICGSPAGRSAAYFSR